MSKNLFRLKISFLENNVPRAIRAQEPNGISGNESNGNSVKFSLHAFLWRESALIVLFSQINQGRVSGFFRRNKAKLEQKIVVFNVWICAQGAFKAVWWSLERACKTVLANNQTSRPETQDSHFRNTISFQVSPYHSDTKVSGSSGTGNGWEHDCPIAQVALPGLAWLVELNWSLKMMESKQKLS